MPVTIRHFRLTHEELAGSLLIAAVAFAVVGTVTALWRNPFFTRMTPAGGYELWLLVAESSLLGLYFGVRSPVERRTCSAVGGVLGFLGVACPVCNKVLLLVFGAGFLLSYFEPARLYVGLAGVALLAFALYRKLSLRPAPLLFLRP